MNGRIVGGGLVAFALLFGAAVWYFQVHAFYERVTPVLEARLPDGSSRPIPLEGAEGIDATTSPLKFRACARVAEPVEELAEALPRAADPRPLNAPYWFSCFDAGQLTADIAAGRATAYMLVTEIRDGADRLAALYPDGRLYAWHQLNEKYAD